MIARILVVLGLIAGGAVLGLLGGYLWVNAFMPNAGLEGLMPPFVGVITGAVVGLGIGLHLAYRSGKKETEDTP